MTALALFVPLLGTMIAVLLSSRAAPPCVEPGTPARDKQYPAPPCTFIDEFGRYEVEMQTSVGTLRMLINPRLGVAAANNFLFLAQEGFYNGTTFHRVENDDNGAFAQGGDPTGTGRGGPGYTFVAESPSPIAHYGRGVVALLNPQDPNKTGSQFFIVARDLEDISKPGQTRYYTPIGFLADETSRSVLDQIVAAPRQDSRPVTPVVIHSARIKLISSS